MDDYEYGKLIEPYKPEEYRRHSELVKNILQRAKEKLKSSPSDENTKLHRLVREYASCFEIAEWTYEVDRSDDNLSGLIIEAVILGTYWSLIENNDINMLGVKFRRNLPRGYASRSAKSKAIRERVLTRFDEIQEDYPIKKHLWNALSEWSIKVNNGKAVKPDSIRKWVAKRDK